MIYRGFFSLTLFEVLPFMSNSKMYFYKLFCSKWLVCIYRDLMRLRGGTSAINFINSCFKYTILNLEILNYLNN